jgi:hypothetical protein
MSTMKEVEQEATKIKMKESFWTKESIFVYVVTITNFIIQKAIKQVVDYVKNVASFSVMRSMLIQCMQMKY